MEQTSQASLARGDQALREELGKWRERVPKLAAALRQRAEEVQRLQQELERMRGLQPASGEVPAGIGARDELIEELEQKLADVSSRHKDACGELHRQQLEIDELRAAADGWKAKWRTVTQALDEQQVAAGAEDDRLCGLQEENAALRRQLEEQSSSHEADRRALEEAVQERDSLRHRNEQLFETTELANRQIGSLTESLSELRASVKQHRALQAEADDARARLREEVEALRPRLTEAEETIRRQAAELKASAADASAGRERAGELEARLEQAEEGAIRAEQDLLAVTEELHQVSSAALAAARSAAAGGDRVAELERAKRAVEVRLAQAEAEGRTWADSCEQQAAEVARLTEMVERAQRITDERERERRELSTRLQQLEERNERLDRKLADRSDLVVVLEQDQARQATLRESLERERDELQEALVRAERNVKENADYVAQLDDKLERQKELMLNLEKELAETKNEQARHEKSGKAEKAARAGADAEVKRLEVQVRKLEGLLRDRTEAVNRLQWQLHLADERRPSEAEGGADARTLVVLNQQLADARDRNDLLLAKVRELEGRRREARPSSGDDLTRIHGVGEKLAEQLNELGIFRYRQIAELDEHALAEEDHVLHAHRGRIVRDGWIQQAARLISH